MIHSEQGIEAIKAIEEIDIPTETELVHPPTSPQQVFDEQL